MERALHSITGQFIETMEFHGASIYCASLCKALTIPAARLQVITPPSVPAPAPQQLILEVLATNLFVGQPANSALVALLRRRALCRD